MVISQSHTAISYRFVYHIIPTDSHIPLLILVLAWIAKRFVARVTDCPISLPFSTGNAHSQADHPRQCNPLSSERQIRSSPLYTVQQSLTLQQHPFSSDSALSDTSFSRCTTIRVYIINPAHYAARRNHFSLDPFSHRYETPQSVSTLSHIPNDFPFAFAQHWEARTAVLHLHTQNHTRRSGSKILTRAGPRKQWRIFHFPSRIARDRHASQWD